MEDKQKVVQLERRIAELEKQLRRATSISPVSSNEAVAWFRTPMGGIPARTVDWFGHATCTKLMVYEGPSVNQFTFSGLSGADEEVFNPFGAIVGEAGSVLIRARRFAGIWIVELEDCSGG